MTDPTDAPAVDQPTGGSRRAKTRTHLTPVEQRRMLWRFLPWAVAVVLLLNVLERSWRRAPPPPAPQVETALDIVRGPRPAGTEVIVEAPVDAVATRPSLSARSAADDVLSRVRDDTFFREADMEAWVQTWRTLSHATADDLTSAPPVSFGELFGQPRSFRGRLVSLRGTLHRVEYLAAPANAAGLEGYWQGWLEPTDGPSSPIIIQFLESPEGMPTGLRVHEAVDVVGYFLKRHAYQATDTVRVAPLVMAKRPLWRPTPRAPDSARSPAAWLPALFAVMMGLGVAALWLVQRSGRRSGRHPVDVDAALAGYEPVTIGEALRRMAMADGAPTTEPLGVTSETQP